MPAFESYYQKKGNKLVECITHSLQWQYDCIFLSPVLWFGKQKPSSITLLPLCYFKFLILNKKYIWKLQPLFGTCVNCVLKLFLNIRWQFRQEYDSAVQNSSKFENFVLKITTQTSSENIGTTMVRGVLCIWRYDLRTLRMRHVPFISTIQNW